MKTMFYENSTLDIWQILCINFSILLSPESIPLSFIGREQGNGKRIDNSGSLTVAKTDTIQSFFGLAIGRNKGDPDEMV